MDKIFTIKTFQLLKIFCLEKKSSLHMNEIANSKLEKSSVESGPSASEVVYRQSPVSKERRSVNWKVVRTMTGQFSIDNQLDNI